jgi:hypothetical protein
MGGSKISSERETEVDETSILTDAARAAKQSASLFGKLILLNSQDAPQFAETMKG